MKDTLKNIFLSVALIMIALGIYNGINNYIWQRSAGTELNYPTFITAVNEGKVSTATISGRELRGHFQDNKAFTTELSLQQDPNLLPLLLDKGVVVKGMLPRVPFFSWNKLSCIFLTGILFSLYRRLSLKNKLLFLFLVLGGITLLVFGNTHRNYHKPITYSSMTNYIKEGEVREVKITGQQVLVRSTTDKFFTSKLPLKQDPSFIQLLLDKNVVVKAQQPPMSFYSLYALTCVLLIVILIYAGKHSAFNFSFKKCLLWLALGITFFLVFETFFSKPAIIQIAYSTLIENIKQNNVSTVTITGQSVEGVFLNNKPFTSYLPLEQDPALLLLLHEKKITVK